MCPHTLLASEKGGGRPHMACSAAVVFEVTQVATHMAMPLVDGLAPVVGLMLRGGDRGRATATRVLALKPMGCVSGQRAVACDETCVLAVVAVAQLVFHCRTSAGALRHCNGGLSVRDELDRRHGWAPTARPPLPGVPVLKCLCHAGPKPSTATV